MNKIDQIELLRNEHANAVNNFDFDRAEIIDKQINRLQNELKRGSNNDVFGEHAVDLDEQREILLCDSARFTAQFMEERTELQKKYHKRYVEMQERHTEEMQNLINQQAMAIERETTRTIPDVEKLQNQSKIKGRQHNYAEAKKLYQDSLELKAQVIEQRRIAVNNEYERIKNKLKEKQQEEIQLLAQKQETALKDMDSKKVQHEELMQTKYKIKEQRAKQQSTPRAVMMRTVSPAVKRRRSQSVTRSVRANSSFSSARNSRSGSRLSFH